MIRLEGKYRGPGVVNDCSSFRLVPAESMTRSHQPRATAVFLVHILDLISSPRAFSFSMSGD